MTELLTISGVTALVLLIEHLALWRRPWRLSRPAAYALGTGTITLGYTGWAWSINQIGAAVGLWFIVGICGAVIWGAYLVRKALTILADDARIQGQAARPRAAMPLSQDAIDHGNS